MLIRGGVWSRELKITYAEQSQTLDKYSLFDSLFDGLFYQHLAKGEMCAYLGESLRDVANK